MVSVVGALVFCLQATPPPGEPAALLLARARRARAARDSTLQAYEAASYQRVSVALGVGSTGIDRLLLRHETTARIAWRRDAGLWIDITGARASIPMALAAAERAMIADEIDNAQLRPAVPYYPGFEPLWMGTRLIRDQSDESTFVHPLMEGAEHYYSYTRGDSLTLRLPDGRAITLYELRVRPRWPSWKLVLGSLWFEASGQLVRAVYRLAAPIDPFDSALARVAGGTARPPGWLRPMLSPTSASISSVEVEYGLYDGRFWLPRTRIARGSVSASFLRGEVMVEERFSYSSFDASRSMPTAPRLQLGSVQTSRRLNSGGRPRGQCDTASVRVSTDLRGPERIPAVLRSPCDPDRLADSPDLPSSRYASHEALFEASDLVTLEHEALGLAVQAPFMSLRQAHPAPVFAYGPPLMRYNRVEGLSLGASVAQEIGGGVTVSALSRLGLADRKPNFDLTARRDGADESMHGSAYAHLVAAGDWGQPLSFSSSVAALLFGRDEGFYYRAAGLEVGGERRQVFRGNAARWRAFAEEDAPAPVNTTYAVTSPNLVPNIAAIRATYVGGAAEVSRGSVIDPSGALLSSSLHAEAAMGTTAYVRVASDVSSTLAFGWLAASLSASAGSSIGVVPPQRLWFLGGLRTVRGESPDTAQSGNGFWLARAELGAKTQSVRPTLFADVGCVGDRAKVFEADRLLSGIGAGLSIFDGLFRFDVARGLSPRHRYRFDFSLDSRF